MNIAVFLSTRGWHLRPNYRHVGWPLKNDKRVWYISFFWLWFGFQIDNEE